MRVVKGQISCQTTEPRPTASATVVMPTHPEVHHIWASKLFFITRWQIQSRNDQFWFRLVPSVGVITRVMPDLFPPPPCFRRRNRRSRGCESCLPSLRATTTVSFEEGAARLLLLDQALLLLRRHPLRIRYCRLPVPSPQASLFASNGSVRCRGLSRRKVARLRRSAPVKVIWTRRPRTKPRR